MVTMLASFQACGTWSSSHALLIHRCSLLDKLAPPYFHTSAGIPSPPGAFPSLSPLIALTISSIVGFSSRAVLTLRLCFPAPRVLCPQEHWVISESIHSILPSHFCYLWRFLTYQMISDVQVVSSVDPTLPLIHCKNPCRSCERLSVAQRPLFPTIQTFELVYISVVFCMHLCKPGQRIWCFWSATLFGGLGPF